jgi:hypothetical protein
MIAGVRIGVCSDVHGRHDGLVTVLSAMSLNVPSERRAGRRLRVVLDDGGLRR